MSSYAEAAASSGPIGADKLPSPPQVHSTSDPSGSVEVLEDEEFEKEKQEFEKKSRDYVKEATEEISKDINDIEDRGKGLIGQISASLKKSKETLCYHLGNAFKKTSETSSCALVKTSEELKNPVVIAQSLVTVAGAASGYLLYLERHRINTDNKVVLGIHASVITGLILVDGYLFSKFYPKYDKKN